jgi:hypothetical protein
MRTDQFPLADIPGLHRVETTSRDQMMAAVVEMTHSVYPHDQVYGSYCTIQGHIDCPPELVFEYLKKGHHLEEWTYSLRGFKPTDQAGLWAGEDRLEHGTKIYCRVTANAEAMTVDYHCAWDQADTLWMIYLMRVVPAEVVLNKPGAVVLWTNCRHPYYDGNPHPELASTPGRPWVGDYWDLFYAGHTLELNNLKAILEHRHRAGLPAVTRPASAVAR